MTPETVVDIVGHAIAMGNMISLPIHIISLIVGVLVGVFQAATQINDQTLVVVPKIVVSIVALAVFGFWMLQTYLDFVREVFLQLPTMRQ